MLDRLQDIKLTIDLNEDILIDSVDDTNDLVVSDLLKDLGYDRKRSNRIQRLRNNSKFSWKLVTKNQGQILVMVLSFNDSSIDEIDCNTIYCTEENLVGFIVTNGSKLKLFDAKYPNDPAVIDIDLFESDDRIVEHALDILSSDSNIEEFLFTQHKESLENIVKQAIKSRDTSIFSKEFFEGHGFDDISTIYDLFITNENNQEDTGFDKSEYESKIKILEDKLNELTKEYELAKSSLDNSQSTIDELREKYSDSLNTNNSLTKEINELKEKLNNCGTQDSPSNDSLNNSAELDEMNKTIASLTSEIRIKDKAIDGYNQTIDELKKDIETKDKSIQELHDKLVKMSDDSNEDSINDRSYRAQIERLASQITDLEDKINSKDAEIDDLKDKLANKVDPKVIAAKELIDAVNDDPDQPRSYVGVVNGNLFQAPTLEKFIGMALQELYSCVSFELMPFLFDGDIFKLSDKAVRKDMVIGNRVFDLDLSNLSEEESLLRLKTLFGKFPAVVFFEKSIGTITNNDDISCDALDNSDNDTEIIESNEDFENESFENNGEYTSENLDEHSENLGLGIDNENGLDLDESDGQEFFNEHSESEDVAIDNDEIADSSDNWDNDSQEEPIDTNGYLGFAVSDLCNVLWNEECSLDNPEYIMNSGDILKIRNSSFKDQIQSIIYSLLLFSPNYTEAINALRRVDFKTISNKVTDYPTEGAIRIPYTKFLIEADNIGMVLPILTKICEVALVDANTTEIVFSGTAKVPGIFADYFIDTSEWQFNSVNEESFFEDNCEYSEDESARDQHCIISASILNAIVMNTEQIEVQSNLIKKCIAIRTNYLTNQITNSDDIAYVVTEILANSESPLDDVMNKVSNIVGEKYKFISRNSEEVGEDYLTAHLNGDDYYIANTEDWKLIYSLIQLHVLCTGNNSISLRVILDKKLYDFYNTKFIEFDPVKMAAVKSFIVYASDRLK